MAKKGGLGKGLDALFLDNDTNSSGTLMRLRLSQVEPNKAQPRRQFDEAALAELADSIREHGVLQPIAVRPLPDGSYQIIAGERRWRASRLAGLTEIPAVIVDAGEQQVMELALIENLQREDLSPLEEAEGYRTLIERYGLTQEQTASRVGKSRPVVANALRLLELPAPALEKLKAGEITAGHARVLAGVPDGEMLSTLLERTVKEGLSVRALEKLSRAQKPGKPREKKGKAAPAWGDPYCREAEISLTEQLSAKVLIKQNGEGGTLSIEFYSREQLQELVKKLSGD